ncbi:MAG: flagellum-specific ATP synthase FliI, partial [Lachnospiraceae bacterium]|nr:flagellum-specific ATP synthase FliI [Lachnospiraceae bacterium]
METKKINFSKYNRVAGEGCYTIKGKVVNVVGLTIESKGPQAKLGDICRIYPGFGQAEKRPAIAEVVGFKEGKVLLMPYENVEGIGPGSSVENTNAPLKVRVDDGLLGRTLDGLGRPDDGYEVGGREYSVEAKPPDPMSRKIIDEVLPLGVKAVDGLITVGKGQRIGIFAGSGVGKSTLMGMFARNTRADINVIALIGER